MTRPTYWNGQPCEARKVRVVVADNPSFPHYWARVLVGTERAAVEVVHDGKTFYIDDEGYERDPKELERLAGLGVGGTRQVGYDGWGWAKVTVGHGSPSYGHGHLAIERVVE